MFPNLGSDDVIVPGMANLSFNIELSSKADPNRTLVSNIARVIVEKLAVKSERNEILRIDDSMCSHATEMYGRQIMKSGTQ